ncbi:DNA polymerase III subunit gamma/tau [Flavobacterium sp.]|uniref:DNA polymerase III subunit gamma/tau n=1 Tax=Flavobacterium sp. TaxID=239 RepID=UPI0025B8A477|nr:DNA polymerase III subunit gamma/tau [Flavobacterium sp.]
MLNAIGLHHFRWRKKKVEQFIIPPTYFKNAGYSIVEVVQRSTGNQKVEETISTAPVISSPEIVETDTDVVIETPTTTVEPIIEVPKPNISNESEAKVSALSLSSIRAKKALEETSKTFVKEAVHLPTESFTETEMLLQWNKYAQRLGDKGYKIMESLLLINDPVLNGTHITIELPNEGSKLDFESEKLGLLGYLKGHLHNHDITIEVIVNESFESKRSFNDQDRYNRLQQLNPNIELLRTTFGLDIT